MEQLSNPTMALFMFFLGTAAGLALSARAFSEKLCVVVFAALDMMA